MTSPFVVSPVAYGDAPSGGVVMPMIIAARVPSNTIDKLPAGYWWLSSLDQFIVGPGGTVTYGNGNLYYQAGNSGGLPNWILVSDSSGPIVGINGTANQITAINAAGTVTLSIPATFIAPGSIASTTTITAGTGLTVTSGGAAVTGTTTINTSGAAVTTIGTGGTGAVNIGNATGNTAVTGTLTSTAGITASTGNIVATAGQVNAGTSMTAGTSITSTLGNITATNGNIVRGTAGNKDVYTSVATDGTAGANSAGTATLSGGTVTINTTAVTASSIIRLYRQGIGSTGAAALGILTTANVVAATSFDINSVQAADATALQASDVSVVAWEIVN